jgi:hypothetical protein
MIDLYVDDVRTCPYVGWITVRTVTAAKEWLAAGAVEHLSLDHDMGMCDACRQAGKGIGDMSALETTFMLWCPHAEDGTKLVHWMIETGNWSRFKPEVHSANPVGAARMRGMIERYWPGSHGTNQN